MSALYPLDSKRNTPKWCHIHARCFLSCCSCSESAWQPTISLQMPQIGWSRMHLIYIQVQVPYRPHHRFVGLLFNDFLSPHTPYYVLCFDEFRILPFLILAMTTILHLSRSYRHHDDTTTVRGVYSLVLSLIHLTIFSASTVQ